MTREDLGDTSRLAEPDRREPPVPRRQREATRIANGLDRDDLDREVELGHQPADHEQLLKILLAEVGTSGSRHREQLRHNGRDTVEVARTHGTLQPLGDAPDAHRDEDRTGVQLLDDGCEHPVRTGVHGGTHVRLQGPRIGRKVGGVVELQRIDEDGDDHDVVALPRSPNQRLVPLVERTHRRHEADGSPGVPGRCERLAEPGDGPDQRVHAHPAA